VLKGLVELKRRLVGVYASTVIKKRRYWPKYVPGDTMDDRMNTRRLGETDSLAKGLLGPCAYYIHMICL
jgi:hypothetical protein